MFLESVDKAGLIAGSLLTELGYAVLGYMVERRLVTSRRVESVASKAGGGVLSEGGLDGGVDGGDVDGVNSGEASFSGPRERSASTARWSSGRASILSFTTVASPHGE